MCYSQKGLLQVIQHNDSDLDSVDTVRYLRAGLEVKGYMFCPKKKVASVFNKYYSTDGSRNIIIKIHIWVA